MAGLDFAKRHYWKDRALKVAEQLAHNDHNPYIKQILDYLDHAGLVTDEVRESIRKASIAVEEIYFTIALIKIGDEKTEKKPQSRKVG